MKKVIKLTEADIENIVRQVISEQLSVSTYRDPDFKSKIYDTNNPKFVTFLKGIENNSQRFSKMGSTPAYDAMVRNKAKMSNLRYDKNKKSWVETPNQNLTSFKQREKQIKKFIQKDPVSEEIMNKVIQNNYAFWVWVIGFYGSTLLGGLQGKKNPTIVMDDIESIKQMPPQKPKLEMPALVMNDQQKKVGEKFDIGSAQLKQSYVTSLPTDLKGSFAKAVEIFREQYPDMEFKGNVYIKTIKVTSSSSKISQDNMKNARYRTGPNGTPDGYKNLSEDRAKALLNTVLNFIKSDKSVVIDGDTKQEVDFLGENKDGTSGPDWDRTESGKKQLEQYQQAYITLEFTVIPTPPTPVEIPQLKSVTDYSIRASGEGRRRITIDLTLPTLKWPRINIGGWITNFFNTDIPCPF